MASNALNFPVNVMYRQGFPISVCQRFINKYCLHAKMIVILLYLHVIHIIR